MGLKSPEELYKDAIKNNYGLGAFNTYSLESLLAVMEAAQTQRSPIIIQVSMGARKYVKYLEAYIDIIKRLAEEYDFPMFIQHDHCLTIENAMEAIDAGIQAVMFDGSHLEYEKNIEETSKIVDYAHKRGVWVEAELGCLPGFEDYVFSDKAVLTDPKKVQKFIESTGCDSLAIAVGTSHGGIVGDDYLTLHLDLLKEIVGTNKNYPYVLHGGASLPPELIKECNDEGGKVEYLRNCSETDIAKAVKYGIRKVNMDVDNFLVFTTKVRRYLNENPSVYDPRKYLAEGTRAFQKEVEHKLKNVLDSANRY